MSHDPESGSLSEYFSRIDERITESSNMLQKLMQIEHIASSAQHHFERFDLARGRWERAKKLKDKVGLAYEKEVITALLYEILDTTYIVLGLLNLDDFSLDSSTDGIGLTGDSAPSIVQIIGILNVDCRRVFELAKECDITLSFAEAVDERQGVTCINKAHWQDFEPGSVSQSFFEYFKKARSTVKKVLARNPQFWKAQTQRQYLERHNYEGIMQAVDLLLSAPSLAG